MAYIKNRDTYLAIQRELSIRLEIINELKQYSYAAIAKRYGTGEKAIYHRARKLGLQGGRKLKV